MPFGVALIAGWITFSSLLVASFVPEVTDARGYLENPLFPICDPINKVTTVTEAGKAPVQIRYEAHGRTLSEAVMVDGMAVPQTSYVRDPETLAPTRITDALGRSTLVKYSSLTSPTSITAADGTTATLTYRTINGVETVERIEFPSGGRMAFAYDDRGFLTSVTDPQGNVTDVTSNDRGQPTSIVTAGGSRITVAYESHGLPETIEQTRPGETAVARAKTRYDNALNPTEVTDARGFVTHTDFDARGLPTRITDAAGGVTDLVFDGSGLLKQVTDANRHLTVYERDNAGRVTQITNPANQPTTITYLRGSLLSSVQNSRLETTRRGYDSQDRLVATTDALGGVTRLEYNAASELRSRQDPRGGITTFEYTPTGQLDTQLQPDGSEVAFRYNSNGEMVEFLDARGLSWKIRRDGSGRPRYLADPTGVEAEILYDADGLVTLQRDRLGQSTSYSYDAQRRLASTTLPGGKTYRFYYDLVGNLERIQTPRGGNWDYTYDGLSRLKTARDPLGNERRWDYDAMGLVTRIEEPGEGGIPLVTTITYNDLLDRPTKIEAPGRTTNLSYNDNVKDAAAKSSHEVVITLQPEGTTLTRKFDALERLVREDVLAGGVTTTMVYAWDAASNLIEVKQSTGGQIPVSVLQYTYDSMNRLATITDARRSRIFTLEHLPTGQLSAVIYPRGARKFLTWGDRGELQKIEYRNASNTPVRTIGYSYDNNLQILAVKVDGVTQAAYRYDVQGRLEHADYAGGDFEDWVFDDHGNVTTYATRSGTETRTYDTADQVLTITRPLPASGTEVLTHVHDPRGNLRQVISAGEVRRELTWDAQGWLTKVTVGGVEKLRATYLDDYRLRSLQTPQGYAMFTWNMGNIASEFDATAAETRFNVSSLELDSTLERGPPGVVSRETLVTDHLEGLLGGLDDAGNPTAVTEYRAYGGVRAGPDPGTIGFAGARRDAGTGYLYLRNRWLDPSTGRFLSRDPIGFDGGFNLYQYVGENPVNFRDPKGLIRDTGWEPGVRYDVSNPYVLGPTGQKVGAALAGAGALALAPLPSAVGFTIVGTYQMLSSGSDAAAAGTAVGLLLKMVPQLRLPAGILSLGAAIHSGSPTDAFLAGGFIAAVAGRRGPSCRAPESDGRGGGGGGGDGITELLRSPNPRYTKPPQAALEVVEGFDAANYPARGPYFTDQRKLVNIYRLMYRQKGAGGLQTIRLRTSVFERMKSEGILIEDSNYPSKAWYVPLERLNEFNQLVLEPPPNSYTP